MAGRLGILAGWALRCAGGSDSEGFLGLTFRLRPEAREPCFPPGGVAGRTLTWEYCCDTKWDLLGGAAQSGTPSDAGFGNFERILAGSAALAGNPACFDAEFTHDRCCRIDAMAFVAPWTSAQALPNPWEGKGRYAQVAFRVAVGGAVYTVLQSAALSNFQRTYASSDFHLGFVPRLEVDVDGLLWAGGIRSAVSLCEMDFGPAYFERAPRRFLEVAAGTGLASLVAQRRGFEVVSTDLRADSEWQRAASARLNGCQSGFATASLDLLAEAWPKLGRFDVIWVSAAVSPDAAEAERDPLRLASKLPRLAWTFLRPDGLFVITERLRTPASERAAVAAWFAGLPGRLTVFTRGAQTWLAEDWHCRRDPAALRGGACFYVLDLSRQPQPDPIVCPRRGNVSNASTASSAGSGR